MKPLHQSGMKVAADCLARYKAERIDGVDGSSTAADVGTLVHKGVEAGYVAQARNEAPAPAAIDAIYREFPDATPGVFAAAENGLHAIYASDLYLSLPGPGSHMQVEWTWGLTEDFQPCDPADPACAFTGRMDEVRWGKSGVQERDWKYILGFKKKEDVKLDIQRRVYAVALLAYFDVPSTRGGFVLLRHAYEVWDDFGRDEPWHAATKRWMSRIRRHVLAAHESGSWPETLGGGCQWCPVRHSCDTYVRAMRQGKVDPVGAEEAAVRYLHAKGAAAHYERVVKAAAEDAPIPVGVGKLLGYVPRVRKVMRPLADCLALLEEYGATREDIRQCFPGSSINKAGLEKMAVILTKRGEFEGEPHELVDEFREEVPSAVFTTFMDERE